VAHVHKAPHCDVALASHRAGPPGRVHTVSLHISMHVPATPALIVLLACPLAVSMFLAVVFHPRSSASMRPACLLCRRYARVVSPLKSCSYPSVFLCPDVAVVLGWCDGSWGAPCLSDSHAARPKCSITLLTFLWISP
jgi:hypothetical protein